MKKARAGTIREPFPLVILRVVVDFLYCTAIYRKEEKKKREYNNNNIGRRQVEDFVFSFRILDLIYRSFKDIKCIDLYKN